MGESFFNFFKKKKPKKIDKTPNYLRPTHKTPKLMKTALSIESSNFCWGCSPFNKEWSQKVGILLLQNRLWKRQKQLGQYHKEGGFQWIALDFPNDEIARFFLQTVAPPNRSNPTKRGGCISKTGYDMGKRSWGSSIKKGTTLASPSNKIVQFFF